MQTTIRTSHKRRAKFAVGGTVVVAALLGLLTWAMTRPGSTAFFLEVGELKEIGATAVSEEYRVNGNVVPGSVERRGVETSFRISDGSEELEVVTDQPLPDAFWTGYENDPDAVEVVARGRYDGSTFTASEVLAKCPSKFRAKV
jgi:cytochrome c-type biogenesis protein CcmE